MPQNDCKKYSDMIYEYTADMLQRRERARPDAAYRKLFLLPQ